MTNVPVMTAQEVMDLIPNRYPICYIDAVDELVADQKVVARKNVTINERFFQGHFPNNPVMPGVLIIEALAQAASILILKSPKFYKKTAYLGAIHNAVRSNMGQVDAVATVDGKRVCTAKLVFFVADREAKI